MSVQESFFIRKKSELAVSLNEVQKQAVLHTEGPLLLLASPGSGKTTTIIMRIGYLIEEKQIKSSRIKAVTFSKSSALDMKERFSRFFPSLVPVDFSTIHSLAFEVVRDYFYKNGIDYQLIEGEGKANQQEPFNPLLLQKKLILRNLYKSINETIITDDQLEELTTYISFIKNKLLPEDKWSTIRCDVKEADRILAEYERFKQAGTDKLLVDYDDMLTIANQAFETDSALLEQYQRRYDYVLTDESQDTSLVQHSIIEKLVRVHQNLCVVADDDQSIYTWRAAEPQYLLDFKQVYPTAEILFMEQNYRSSKDIVETANQFIKRNKMRYSKNMFTENAAYQPITIKTFREYDLQSKYIVEQVWEMTNYRNVAVLYRNNSSSIMLMNAFDRAGIPFYMKDSDNRFFSHWVVEDILNFMRITFNDRRPDLVERVHTKMSGYISKLQMANLMRIRNEQSVFDNLLKYVELKDYQLTHIQETKKIFLKLKGAAPLEAIRTIRKKLGYELALEKMCKSLGFSMEYLLDILDTLEEIAAPLETMEQFAKRLKHLESLLKTSKFNKNKNAVIFSTFHSAKGLEFSKVYMIDLIEGIIPSKADNDAYNKGKTEQMEEAVRLFYVGMTRAELNLELLTYKKKYGKDMKESTFIKDVQRIIAPPQSAKKDEEEWNSTFVKPVIPYNPKAIKDFKQFQTGLLVKHRVFGEGEIIQVDSELIEIRFKASSKKLSIAACIDMGLLELAESV